MKHILMTTVAVLALGYSASAQAQTKIELQRFFGACDADYGTSIEVEKARGECGLMSACRRFRRGARHPDMAHLQQPHARA